MNAIRKHESQGALGLEGVPDTMMVCQGWLEVDTIVLARQDYHSTIYFYFWIRLPKRPIATVRSRHSKTSLLNLAAPDASVVVATGLAVSLSP